MNIIYEWSHVFSPIIPGRAPCLTYQTPPTTEGQGVDFEIGKISDAAAINPGYFI